MKNTFRTSEIQLASSLLSKKGFKYLCIEKSDKGEIEIVIQYVNQKTLLKLLEEDLDNTLKIDFEKYKNNMILLNEQIQIFKLNKLN